MSYYLNASVVMLISVTAWGTPGAPSVCLSESLLVEDHALESSEPRHIRVAIERLRSAVHLQLNHCAPRSSGRNPVPDSLVKICSFRHFLRF